MEFLNIIIEKGADGFQQERNAIGETFVDWVFKLTD